MASVALTSYFLFPGTRPGFLLSATLYLPKIWYTVLLLLTLQCAMISLTVYPLLYMSTAILSRSVLLNILLVFTGTRKLCYRRIARSDDLRNTATSSGRDPNMVSTSAGVESGNNSPRESILSWMEIMRTTLIRHNSINAANSLKPRTALLNFETTSSSPLSRFVMSCFQRGLSVSCWTDSSITCTQPYWHIHSLSASYSSSEFALTI